MKTKKILLVDDDNDFISAQGALLKHAGYEIYFAFSGAEGFLKAKEVKPDLVILDVNMETQNSGFELNQKIRSDNDLKNIPIIMLTGIETYPISRQSLELYNMMLDSGDFDIRKVLKIQESSNNIAVEYFDENAKPFYLSLDSFVAKGSEKGVLENEIHRFLGQ